MRGSGPLHIELNGTSPGTGHDQISARGGVEVGLGLQLNATLNFPSFRGDQFVIINSDGADAVTSTFNGRPEGATLFISGQQFRISYVGGDGNDVVLTQ